MPSFNNRRGPAIAQALISRPFQIDSLNLFYHKQASEFLTDHWNGVMCIHESNYTTDGTAWNPGSGQGFYGYYGSAWHFLG